MYNYGYRDYQPEAARFTTVDPIRDGANWFAYVNNDPVNYVELWGLECPKASDSAYRYQEKIGIIWHEELDKNNKPTDAYIGTYVATDPQGYKSAGTFTNSTLDFDKISTTSNIPNGGHSIAGSGSVSNARVVDVIQGMVGVDIIVGYDNRPSDYIERNTVTSNLGNTIDITPSSNHTTASRRADLSGPANSSVDIILQSGDIGTRRWYGDDGTAFRDVDMWDHGNSGMHPEVPHEHFPEYGADGKLISR
jgi:hypothetical protein